MGKKKLLFYKYEITCNVGQSGNSAVRWMAVGSDAASDGVVSSDAYPDKVCKVCIKKQHLLVTSKCHR